MRFDEKVTPTKQQHIHTASFSLERQIDLSDPKGFKVSRTSKVSPVRTLQLGSAIVSVF